VLNTGYKDHQPRLPHEHAYRPSGGVHAG
jgi:hypothetical protein